MKTTDAVLWAIFVVGGIAIAADKAHRSGLFKPRYKNWATWPMVIFCRLTRHDSQTWTSGRDTRCVNCGDVV